jgi:two-component system, NtrC family, sensor histidine kinase HydH
MATQGRQLLPLARWGLLAVTVTTAGVLLATVFSSYRSMDRASQHTVEAEGRALYRNIEAKLGRPMAPPTQTALERLFKFQHAAGLRYLGLFTPRGRLLLETGEANAGRDFQARPPKGSRHHQTKIGNRFRMVWYPRHAPPPHVGRRPYPPGKFGPKGMKGAHPPPRRFAPKGSPDHGRTFNGPPIIILEFIAVAADRIRSESRWSLGIGAAAAAALLLITAIFWRVLSKTERAEIARQRDRRLTVLGEMAAVMAHEIRNPLASLKGHAQLLAEMLPAKSREQGKAERVVNEANRLESLSHDLLDFVRTGPLSYRKVDIQSLLRESAATLSPDRINISVAKKPLEWELDPGRIQQVVTNLLKNALQASGETKDVDVSAAVERGQLLICIRDHGEGFSDENAGAIFDPFFTTKVQGTGLGLAVSRRLVTLHGGKLRAENHAAGGAEFQVLLPPRAGDAEHGENPRS